MKTALSLLICLSALLLTACPSGRTSENQIWITGTVATGAPLVGVDVKIFDRTGALIVTVKTDAEGHYDTGRLDKALAPYVVQAEGLQHSLFSVQAVPGISIVNITQHTHLISTLLSPSGNAANLAEEVKANPSVITVEKVAMKKEMVVQLIKPLTDALSINIDPISTPFKADGQGYDQVLDSTQVSIVPMVQNGIQSSNIQLTYKTKLDFNDEAKKQLQFASFNSAAKSVETSRIQISKKDLIESDTMALVLKWVRNMNTCLHLPPEQRRSGPAGQQVLLAQSCKDVFYSGDIHSFMEYGWKIEELFGIFGNLSYPAEILSEVEFVFESSHMGYKQVFIKLKALDDEGIPRRHFMSLSPDANLNNELRWRGNGYETKTVVRSQSQIRYFPSSPDYDFTMSGFNFWIPNKDSTHATFNFDQVVITAPSGKQFFMKDAGPAFSALVMCPKLNAALNTCATDNWYILRSEFFNPANKVFARPVQYRWNGSLDYGHNSDEDMLKIPMYGIFKFEIYFLNNPVPVIQYLPYFGRPKTQAEILKSRDDGFFPKYTDATIAGFNRAAAPYNNIIPPSDGSPIMLSWTGLADVLNLWGSVYDTANQDTKVNSFEIVSQFPSSTKSKSVYCNANSAQEYQCLAAPRNKSFAVGSANGSRYRTEIYSSLLENSVSDFTINTSLFGFYEIENSPGW